jgi:crossover junction endodeoxyribonuclease RuvC
LRILGIDPGSNVTGYGVVETSGRGPVHVAHGTLRPARTASIPVRLAAIQEGLVDVIATHRPDLAVVEQIFVAASARSALVLGQARGVALATASAAGLGVEELTPQEIKRAVVGTGAADKGQVQQMVRRLLDLSKLPAQDAADALAAAICQAHTGRLGALVGKAPRGRSRSGNGRGRTGFVMRNGR